MIAPSSISVLVSRTTGHAGVRTFTNINIVPFRQRSWAPMQLNATFNRWRLLRLLRKARTEVATVWVYDATATPQASGIGGRLAVYHCVDDYAGYVTDPARVALLERAERIALDWADLVFTTSAHLTGRLRPHHGHVVTLGNVADYAHFSRQGVNPETEREIETIPAPRLLFVGSFTRRKVNLEALDAVAREMATHRSS